MRALDWTGEGPAASRHSADVQEMGEGEVSRWPFLLMLVVLFLSPFLYDLGVWLRALLAGG